MVTKAQIEALEPEAQRAWEAMGGGHQATISKQLDSLRRREEPLSLASYLRIWMFQTPPGEPLAFCLATYAPFTPTGPSAPRLFRLNIHGGMDMTNLVLVCQSYHKLRTIQRIYGPEGHKKLGEYLDRWAENWGDPYGLPPWHHPDSQAPDDTPTTTSVWVRHGDSIADDGSDLLTKDEALVVELDTKEVEA